MGIPAIPKFSIPNLCGASPEMDDMLKKKDELMKELEASLEIDASALKEKMDAGLNELAEKMKKLAPEMPDAPDTNLQAEIKSLNSIPKDIPGGLELFNAKLTSLPKTFGEKLTEAGSDIGKELGKLQANLEGGGTGCACGIPNMVVGDDGAVKEKPENPVTPIKEAEKEEKSEVTTPNVSLNVALKDAVGLFNKAAPVMTKAMGNIVQEVSLNGPTVTPRMLEIARETDMEMKETIGDHPGLKRIDNNIGQKHTFNLFDVSKALGSPTASDAEKQGTGLSGFMAQVNNHVKNVERQAELFQKEEAQNKKALLPIQNAYKKAQKPYPENKTTGPSGKLDHIWYFSSSDDKKAIYENMYKWSDWIHGQRKVHEKDLEDARHHENGPEHAPRLVASVEDYIANSPAERSEMESFYKDMQSGNRKPQPTEQAPGGSQVQDGGADAGKAFLMNKHSNIRALKHHKSGLKIIHFDNTPPTKNFNLKMGRSFAELAAQYGNNIPRTNPIKPAPTMERGPASQGTTEPLPSSGKKKVRRKSRRTRRTRRR